jgi:hypothetical protein
MTDAAAHAALLAADFSAPFAPTTCHIARSWVGSPYILIFILIFILICLGRHRKMRTRIKIKTRIKIRMKEGDSLWFYDPGRG